MVIVGTRHATSRTTTNAETKKMPDRKITRIKDFEYADGEYFVTICTQNRAHYFGEIKGGEIQLTEIGKQLKKTIENTHTHNQYAEIPLYTIMPNHVHLIVFIDGNLTPHTLRDVACRVPTTEKPAQMHKTANKQSWLSVTIGGIKSAITRFARENDINFAWQPRFYDRIIRNHIEMNHLADYIEQNPYNWQDDEYNE